MQHKIDSKDDVVALLRSHDINPTSQRVEIAYVLFSRHAHYSAEDVFTAVNGDEQHVSKATVYNTLGLFAEKRLVREVIVDPTKVFYDPNVAPHHHFYNVSTGALMDIAGDNVHVSGLPPLPEGASMEGVDVIVRLRTAS
jgi:Fur family iron response transcriptional regulator